MEIGFANVGLKGVIMLSETPSLGVARHYGGLASSEKVFQEEYVLSKYIR